MGAMRLADLVGREWAERLTAHDGAIDVTGLTADSRDVEQGFLFAALPGTKADGAAFIPDALRRGAHVVLTAPGAEPARAGDTVALFDRNPRRRYAELAARFYAPQPHTIVAVTGTNGKTSVASFTQQIWQRLGLAAASIGTLGVRSPAFDEPFGLTTPDPRILHRALQRLQAAGIEHVAMEASSHGLAQHRLDGVELRAAAITNLTRDHLDYHGTLEAYAYAKLRLFGEVLPASGVVVINADAAIAADVEALSWARGQRLISVGQKGRDLRLEAHQPTADGQRLAILFEGRPHIIDLPLAGLFQASNALVAAGLTLATGAPAPAVFEALHHLVGAPGRLERVGTTSEGASVFIDYAHTPDALETVLRALRPHASGRLHVVFGCGGDRDTGKRPEMGRIAESLADHVIVTDDNPRSEDPALIRAAILKATPKADEIGERGDAIRAAVKGLEAGDVLVVAGKGHEQGQIVAGVERPFSDHAAVRAALAERGGAS